MKIYLSIPFVLLTSVVLAEDPKKCPLVAPPKPVVPIYAPIYTPFVNPYVNNKPREQMHNSQPPAIQYMDMTRYRTTPFVGTQGNTAASGNAVMVKNPFVK